MKNPQLISQPTRDIAVAESAEDALEFSLRHFVTAAKTAIANHDHFHVALSGGSTPKAIYQALAQKPYVDQIPWEKVSLYWGDERCVPPDHEDSNYRMAMEAGFGQLPIPKNQIHRMVTETEIQKHAEEYNALLQDVPFDLIMLGMGDDGHTASLFPETAALQEKEKLVVANNVPQKETCRMTVTYPCINRSKNIVVYILGEGKKEMVETILLAEERETTYPVEAVGTPENKALWILDEAAGAGLLS